MTKDGRILGAAARSARRLRRIPARADAGPALPHARRNHRRLRHRQCRRDQPRRAHQQDAGEPDPRLRRPAALSGAGAAGAAHRRRAWRSIISTSSGAISCRQRSFRTAPPPARSTIPAIIRSAVATATGDGRLDDLKRRRDAARAAGRKYGIGFAAVVEPAMSNMGYLSTLLTAEARDKAGPKNGAVSMVTVNIDPLGAVSVTADVTVQGQGHETVLSQIVADQLGLKPDDIDVVLEMDTAKDQWSIAAGTYSCRFTPGTAVAAHIAASRMAEKLKGIARQAAQRAARRRRACRRQDPQPQQSGQRAAVRPRRRHLALVAGDAARRHGAGAERNRAVDAAGTRAAVERRPHQHVADLRLRVRHVRHRDRSADLSGPRRPLRLDARCRQNPQSDDRRRPDARRVRAGHRRGALRGIRLQRGRRIPDRHVRRLSGPDGERNPAGRDAASGNAVAAHPARRQGPRRRQLHERAGLHRQRHRGRARRQGRAAAGDAAAHPRADGKAAGA